MILADKIINLRKKEGWSQEELAFKLRVSRQSVSKWESAQSIPDMNKILMLSKVFDVSTDYLLKDEMKEEEINPSIEENISVENEKLINVSMETANKFLEMNENAAPKIGFGVMLCILSPILLMVMLGAKQANIISITENQSSMIGIAGLVIFVAMAVLRFIFSDSEMKEFEIIKENSLETEYGVDGMVKDRRKKYEAKHTKEIAIGVVLCIMSCIPIFVAEFFLQKGEHLLIWSIGIVLLIVSVGVFYIVKASYIWSGYDVLLETGSYTRLAKKQSKSIGGIYWGSVTIIYLISSFLTGSWQWTWIMWPVAGLLYGLIGEIFKNRMARRHS